MYAVPNYRLQRLGVSEGADLLVLVVYVPIPNTYVRQDNKYESYLLSAMLDCVNKK